MARARRHRRGVHRPGRRDGIGFRDGAVTVRAGEMFVVPKGVEHITPARAECHALLVEPRGVVNTGDAGGALTAPNDVWI